MACIESCSVKFLCSILDVDDFQFLTWSDPDFFRGFGAGMCGVTGSAFHSGEAFYIKEKHFGRES